ncbi:MAG TPA: hypothetical protein VFC68_02590, partial [Treponemataceae bacterium]|nr:hypothetical protein [Treponemataceae bacterium]
FSSQSYTLYFKPINNMLLFQRYNLLGDFLNTYRMSLSYILDSQGKSVFDNLITFSISAEDYNSYKQNLSIDNNLTGFYLEYDVSESKQRAYMDQTGITKATTTHMHENTTDEHTTNEEAEFDFETFVRVSGDSLYLDQWLFKIAPYYLNGELHIYFWIINRMPNQLKLIAPKLDISIEDKVYKPLNDFLDIKPTLTILNADFDSNTLIVGQNDRARFILRYALPSMPQRFVLNTDGITTFQDVNVFVSELQYNSSFKR